MTDHSNEVDVGFGLVQRDQERGFSRTAVCPLLGLRHVELDFAEVCFEEHGQAFYPHLFGTLVLHLGVRVRVGWRMGVGVGVGMRCHCRLKANEGHIKLCGSYENEKLETHV